MAAEETGEKIRLDIWLWHARFFKTRSLATKICKAGKVRINGTHAVKPSAPVKPGDVLTFPQAKQIKIIEIIAPGVRRGPAPEAQMLYKDLTPPPEKTAKSFKPAAAGKRGAGAGRPTKTERRAIDKLMDR